MIRQDIKSYIQENNLKIDDVFLKHRDIDPTNYRVGKISMKDRDEEVITMNESTGVIMDYFYDDIPDAGEFDISDSLVIENGNIEKGKYFISRDGKLRSTYTNKYLTIQSHEIYPFYNIRLINSDSRKGHSKRIQIHRLIAFVFIPNFDPDSKTTVDHINRDKDDFSIKNLRWVTAKENAKNSQKRAFAKSRKYIAYKDIGLTLEVATFSDEELLDHPIYHRGVILDSLHGKNLHYGLYWRIIDLNLLNYLSSINKTLEDIDETLWVNTRIQGVLAHPLGLLKITTQKKGCSNFTYITPGYMKHEKYKYLTICIQGTVYLVHRLIAETFLNNNTGIEFSNEVDHISAITTDNRVENLKICTHKENVNNIVSRVKLSVPVIAGGIVFNSITDCAVHYGVERSTIVNWIKNGKEGFYFKD